MLEDIKQPAAPCGDMAGMQPFSGFTKLEAAMLQVAKGLYASPNWVDSGPESSARYFREQAEAILNEANR